MISLFLREGIFRNRVSGGAYNALNLIVLFLDGLLAVLATMLARVAAEPVGLRWMAIGAIRIFLITSEFNGRVLFGEGKVRGALGSGASEGVILAQETDYIGEDGGVAVFAPHETQVFQLWFSPHIDWV